MDKKNQDFLIKSGTIKLNNKVVLENVEQFCCILEKAQFILL